MREKYINIGSTMLCNSTCNTLLKQVSNLPSFVWPKFTWYVMVMVKCHLLSLHFYPCTDTRYARLLDKVITLFLGGKIFPVRAFLSFLWWSNLLYLYHICYPCKCKYRYVRWMCCNIASCDCIHWRSLFATNWLVVM